MYKPLTGCEARLLRLKQTTPYEKRVVGDFMIVPLDLDVLPPYTALSYAWGSGERPDVITVSGMAVKVTRNLYSILQTICQTDATGHADSLGLLIGNLTDQHMWIDAVCIDQGNGDEKSKQVRMMADIFGKASKTLMWLGEAYDESNVALDWLIGISKMAKSDFDALSDSEKLDRLFDVEAWNALCKLLQRPYFRRRWIIEEAALSQDPWIVCGKKVLEWEAFEVGFDRCGGVLYNLAYKNGLEVPSTDAEALTGIWILRYRLQQGLDTPLFEMLSRCRRCNTVKRRDRVFALLGICQKAEAQSNKVGYEDKIEDIFTRQMLSHVKIWKDLNILCVCNEETRISRPKERYQQPNGLFVNPDDPEWATVATLPKLPTWVPNWTSPRTWWKLGPQSWWAMSKWEPLFNAAGGTQPTIVNLTEAASRGLLKLKGLHVDTVYDVEKTTPPPHPDQRNPCSNFYINCWTLYHKFPLALTPYESETERLDAFWRTITVGGRKIGTNDMFTMDFVRWFCLDFFQDPKADGMFGELLRLRGFYRGEQPPKEKWFVRDDVPPVYWNSDQVAINFDILCEYKFFVTKSGRMGLGPADTVPGDEVCVFHGCSSPLIMYRSASDSTKLCIRGETYIHSFMFGEAVQMVRQGKLQEEIFSLL
jgi:hypothetical protein